MYDKNLLLFVKKIIIIWILVDLVLDIFTPREPPFLIVPISAGVLMFNNWAAFVSDDATTRMYADDTNMNIK